MHTSMLRSFTALFLCAGLGACGLPPEDPAAAPIEQAAQPGATPTDQLPLLDRLPDDGYPAGFDYARGWSEYRLADGHRALFLTRGEDAGAEPDTRSAQAVVSVNPLSDTFFEYLQSGAVQDYGRSCELRVNNGLVSLPQRTLLKFAIPTTVTCSTITSARLTLTTGQLPSSGSLVVEAQRPSKAWTQGGTGLSSCSACKLSTAGGAAFNPPASLGTISKVNVTAPCTPYVWDVTVLAQGWCGGTNNGVMMAGTSGSALVDFHALDAPSNRPLLTIVY